jgi:two-component system CheB/CheR fusion protein
MESPVEQRPHLIVTGSSAGGIDALLEFVSGLPPDLAAPIVIAQHLDPKHASRLREILAKRSPLPIEEVRERTRLADGWIYLVPADRDVEVRDGMAVSVSETRRGPKPSVDRLFTSAAENYQDGAIAIVLSGSGSDGLAGARIVKEHSGTVIVQDLRTAAHPSMPQSIPPTLVDLTAPPAAMGALLGELVRGVATADSSREEGALRALLVQLRERSGIDFTQYKTPTIMRRLSRLMLAAGMASIAEYTAYVRQNPEEYQRLVSAFLINVTEFFRDGPLFTELHHTILPQLIADAAAEGRDLRIWSAGCSTGEEAYSVAILCAELERAAAGPVNFRVFATDLDDAALAFARRGIYGPESLRHVPPEWLERYFVKISDAYEVTKHIRSRTVFGQHDLARRAPFPHIDLCLCRNVLMYFTRDLQMRVLGLFAFALRTGGYLVLGKAESATPLMEHFFTLIDSGLKVYRRYGEPAHIPNLPFSVMVAGAAEPGHGSAATLAGAVAAAAVPGVPASVESVGGSVSRLPIGYVIVNRQYDVLYMNGAARSLLDIRSVGIGEDLVHLSRSIGPAALREAIDAAFRGEVVEPREYRVADGFDAPERWLQIGVFEDRGQSGATDRAVLLVVDVSETVRRRVELEKRLTEQSERDRSLALRMEELSRRQKTLLQANDELAASNAELRGAAQDLQTRAEGAIAATEEIETLNEEMQATNEELETINEELQATVEELNTTNGELNQRGKDLEAIGDRYEGEVRTLRLQRDVLAEVAESLQAAIAVVANDGDLIYASSLVAAWVAAQPAGWWKAGVAEVGGMRYALATREIVHDGKPLRVVSFTA